MFTLDDILQGTQGQLDPASGALAMTGLGFNRVAVDSRGWLAGALFVPLRGRYVDGHDFVLDAAGHGARGALVRSDWKAPEALPKDVALIRVDDPRSALQRLALWWRARHSARIIAVTGATGTTGPTCQVLASTLSTRFPTLAPDTQPEGETGVLLSLLQLAEHHQMAVLGMVLPAGSFADSVKVLCDLIRPDALVLTSAELDGMDDLWACLPEATPVILHADAPAAQEQAHQPLPARHAVLTFGLAEGCDIQATDIESHGYQGVHFTLRMARTQQEWRVRLPLFGHYSVHGALAAAGAAIAVGMDADEVIAALHAMNSEIRLLVVPGHNGCTLIDDTYSSSPASMIAALNLLQDMPGRRLALFGGSLERMGNPQEGYLKVARRASVVTQRLVALGSLGLLIGQEALRVGMAPERVFFAADHNQAMEYLRRVIKPADYVLVKGSRALQLDAVVNALKA
jgi:UDP-N-acetylmuramoyl-tripeptide--D-alanyl-D-alanine ligase